MSFLQVISVKAEFKSVIHRFMTTRVHHFKTTGSKKKKKVFKTHLEKPSKLGSVLAGSAACLFSSLSNMAVSASFFSTSSIGVHDISYCSL